MDNCACITNTTVSLFYGIFFSFFICLKLLYFGFGLFGRCFVEVRLSHSKKHYSMLLNFGRMVGGGTTLYVALSRIPGTIKSSLDYNALDSFIYLSLVQLFLYRVILKSETNGLGVV